MFNGHFNKVYRAKTPRAQRKYLLLCPNFAYFASCAALLSSFEIFVSFVVEILSPRQPPNFG